MSPVLSSILRVTPMPAAVFLVLPSSVLLRVLCGKWFWFPISRSRAITGSPDLTFLCVSSCPLWLNHAIFICAHQRNLRQVLLFQFRDSTITTIFAQPLPYSYVRPTWSHGVPCRPKAERSEGRNPKMQKPGLSRVKTKKQTKTKPVDHSRPRLWIFPIKTVIRPLQIKDESTLASFLAAMNKKSASLCPTSVRAPVISIVFFLSLSHQN